MLKFRYEFEEKTIPAAPGRRPRIEQRGRVEDDDGPGRFSREEAQAVAQMIETEIATVPPGHYRWVAEYVWAPDERSLSFTFVCVPFEPAAPSPKITIPATDQPETTAVPTGI